MKATFCCFLPSAALPAAEWNPPLLLRLSPLPTAFLSSKLNSLEGLANQGKAEEEIILKLGSRHLKQNHSFSIKSGSLNKLIWGEMKTLFDHKNNCDNIFE